MRCPVGRDLLAPAPLKLKPYTRFTQVGVASGSYLKGAYPFAFLITLYLPAWPVLEDLGGD